MTKVDNIGVGNLYIKLGGVFFIMAEVDNFL